MNNPLFTFGLAFAIVPSLAIQGWSDGMAMTEEEKKAHDREKSHRWREANLERSREQERIRARRAAAAKAEAEGCVAEVDLFRPKAVPLTEDEKREKRRIKSAGWREKNRERSREITRESMKRASDAKAIAEGREPGKIGGPKKFTEEEKRAKRKAKTERNTAAHLDEVREKARIREQAKRDGTFVSRALPRLTEEEALLAGRVNTANRRARVNQNGGKFTRADVLALLLEQGGCCAICDQPFGEDGYHIDHWKPLSRGGTNAPSNLKLTHPVCNLKKGARLPEEIGLSDPFASPPKPDPAER